MSDERQTLTDLKQLGEATGTVEAPPVPEPETIEQRIDDQGRAYATGKRKDAVARVWIKGGSGQIVVNGRKFETYFARPVLQMIVNQPFAAADRDKQFDVWCTVKGGGFVRAGRCGAPRC